MFLASCQGEHKGSPFTNHEGAATPSIVIAPKDVSLAFGETLRFTATVNSPEAQLTPVSWSATGGFIDQTGLFRAGHQPGTYQVRAEVETALGVLVDVSAGLVVPDEDETEPDPDTTDLSTVLFQDDFESSDFRNWSDLAPSGDSWWSGMGGGGAHLGDGYITNEQVHSGRLAWKAMIDPSRDSFDDGLPHKSSLARWKSMQGISEFYVSAWYYIPTNYPAVSTLIMQAKASNPTFAPLAFRMVEDRELIVRSGITNETLQRTGVKAPLGRWFNLTGRFVIANSGLIELWLDGNKIASVRTDTKDSDFAYPGVGNYILGSQYPVKCHIYIDDVKITTGPPR